MTSLLLFACFGVVVIIAGILISYNRQHARRQKAQRDFTSSEETSNNIQDDFADAGYDDVVESKTSSARSANAPVITIKSYNRQNPASIKTNTQPKDNHENSETKTQAKPATKSKNLAVNDLIILNVMAKQDRPYVGYELLQALLSAGLRYGKMQIFHRYEQLNGSGNILFSLASIAKPGTFDIPKMGGFISPGLTLFMEISGQKDAMATFELMYDTAKQLVEDVGGDVCDEFRVPLTSEKLEEVRSRLIVDEEAKQSEDMFA